MAGEVLKKLDDLGIANNTIAIYTTDNGAETFSWPDGGATPFRGEKNTNWEGGCRVPAMVRWPGLVPPRTEINDIFSAEDWATTLVAAAGEPEVKSKLLQGYDAAGKNFKVHLDGYDQRDLLARKGPDERREFFYWTDDGNLTGLRYENGAAPPSYAFWSITLYDADGFQVANPINRFAVSSWMPFKHNADGSLDLYIQNENPGKDKEANWLPAPKGSFNLTMRIYAPKSETLTGKWNPPPVTRVQSLPGLVGQ
jgi:arylsulfatase A-like enzyme